MPDSQKSTSRLRIALYCCGILTILVAGGLWIRRPHSLSRSVAAVGGVFLNENRDIAWGIRKRSWDRLVYGAIQTVRGKESRTVSINFYKADVTDEWVRRNAEAIRQFPLHSLSFRKTDVTDAAVIELAGLRDLAILDLCGTAVTEKSAAAIRNMPNLQLLDLSDTAATLDSISQLADHPRLRHLDLDGDVLTDETVAYLKAMPSLGSLGLRDFDNQQLRRLVDLKGLYALSLTAATDESLPTLLQLGHLKSLHLVDCRLSREAIETIRTAHPNLSIGESTSMEAQEELGIPAMLAAGTRVKRLVFALVAILGVWTITLLWRSLRWAFVATWHKSGRTRQPS